MDILPFEDRVLVNGERGIFCRLEDLEVNQLAISSISNQLVIPQYQTSCLFPQYQTSWLFLNIKPAGYFLNIKSAGYFLNIKSAGYFLNIKLRFQEEFQSRRREEITLTEMGQENQIGF